ncbi:hypothetical protein KBB12_02145 [Candidatus Woesebacteria bacterium]|nr:hypothetical protein [Candidatus Woesebacteria bacterium]
MQQFNSRLVQRTELTSDVSLYRFELENGQMSYSPGQFVSFVLVDQATNAKLVRSYSIAGSDSSAQMSSQDGKCLITSNNFELVVIHVAEGKGTTMLKNLPMGSVLKTVGPAGNLVLKMSGEQNLPMVFCANSTGIAPFRAMLQYLAQSKAFPELYVFWGLKTAQDIYLSDEFTTYERMWGDNGSKLLIKLCLSREASIPESLPVPPTLCALGRIQPSLEKLPARPYQFYVCGGKSFVIDTKAFLTSQFPGSELYVERFN